MSTCNSCRYSEILVQGGTSYTILNPLGHEVSRVNHETILICRAMPPLGGSFPQVTLYDWCGYFRPMEEEKK